MRAMLLLLLALVSCVETAPPRAAAEPVEVSVAALRTDFATSQVAPVPERLAAAIPTPGLARPDVVYPRAVRSGW